VKHLKKFAANKVRNGYQILLHWNTDNVTIFFLTYFTDAQCVHFWLYGRHLCDNPFYPTRVSISRSTIATAAVILLLPSGKLRQMCARAFFKKYLKSFSVYWRKNYHDPLLSLFVANFMFHGLMNNPVLITLVPRYIVTFFCEHECIFAMRAYADACMCVLSFMEKT
jgi:hypothetical protein